MANSAFPKVAGVVFGVIAVLQAYRAVVQIPIGNLQLLVNLTGRLGKPLIGTHRLLQRTSWRREYFSLASHDSPSRVKPFIVIARANE